jgi:cytidylate kinase
MAAENLGRSKAAQRVRQVDGERSRYVRHFFHANWLDLGYYDLVLNSGHFDVARCVAIVAAALESEGAA